MAIFSKFTRSNSEKIAFPWSRKKLTGSSSSLPRYGHGAVLNDSQLLIYGGVHKGNSRKQLFNIDINNISSSSIITTGDIPPLRKHTTIDVLGAFIVLYGGQPLVPNEVWDPHFYVLHTNFRQWSRVLVKGMLPSARSGHIMCLVNGIMYIWGGQYHDEFLNDLCTFNLKSYPTTAEWNCSYFENQGPAPRAGHIGKIYNNRLYIFGGNSQNTLCNDMWYLDLNTYNWYHIETTGRIPPPRHCCGAALVDDTIYIFGGIGSNNNCLNDLYAFRIRSGRWYMLTNIGLPPSPRYGLTLTAIDKKLYLFGGESKTGKAEDASYVFILDCSKIKYHEEFGDDIYIQSSIDNAPQMSHANRNIDQGDIANYSNGRSRSFHRTVQQSQRNNSLKPSYSIRKNNINDYLQDHLHSDITVNSVGKISPSSFDNVTRPSHFPQNKTVKNDKQRQVAPDTNQRYSEDSLDPITAEKEISYMDPVEKKRMIREIMARDILISEMRKKEQWWRTEVSLARMLRSQQGEIFEEPELSEADLISFGKKGSIDELGRDRVMLSNQLVNAKAEIRKLRSHLYKQMEPLSVKLDHAESIRTAALEEASYYRIKYAALKSADFDTFQQLETEREAVLEERLGMALEEKNEIEQTILKIRNQSEYDQSARLLVEERARISQLQSEEAQDAHQNILKELSDMYDTTLITESKVREDAVYIAQLSNQLARRLSSDAENNDNESERNMHIVQLESENIKLRNQLAVLSHQLEQSIDEQENLKAVLSEEDQSYATALLDIEKSIIELDLLKQASLQAQE